MTKAFHKPCLTCGFEVNVKRKFCPNCGCNPKAAVGEQQSAEPAESVLQETETAESVSQETLPLVEPPHQVATVQTELATRDAEIAADDKRTVYVADRDALGYLGNVSCSVRAGQIITDFAVARKMIEAGMPISRMSLDDMMVCPHCRKAIAIPQRRARAG